MNRAPVGLLSSVLILCAGFFLVISLSVARPERNRQADSRAQGQTGSTGKGNARRALLPERAALIEWRSRVDKNA